MSRKKVIKMTDDVEVQQQAMDEGKEKADRIKKYRQEVSRKASMANKRLKRLEGKGMTDSPAYKAWSTSRGGEYFSVRGKSYREVQQELAEINRYLDSATSSITGANKIIKQIANTTGMKIEYSDWNKNNEQVKNFFEIASQIEQYLRTVEDKASAIGYQKIWEQINRYVEDNEIDLANTNLSMEQISQDIINAQDVFDEESTTFKYGDFEQDGFDIWDTVILDKDKE